MFIVPTYRIWPAIITLFAAAIVLPTSEATAAGKGGRKTEVLHVFKGTPDGNYPADNLLPLAGALYGVTAYGGDRCAAVSTGCGLAFETVPSAHGTAMLDVYRFKGPPGDGAQPGSGVLVADASGALYGTTIGGGSGTCNYFGLPGCGVVYKLTPTAKGYSESVIYNFQGKSDGANPVEGVVLDVEGNLYGTTSAGGLRKCTGGGCGVVYKLTVTPSGYEESVIHRFESNDGAFPDAAPIIDASGALFGTTFDGGTGSCNTYGGGCGTVYSLTPNGRKEYKFATVYSFQGGADGVQAQGGLYDDKQGNLFGMTTYGGTGPCTFSGLPSGCGTIYKLTRTGTTYAESIIHNFTGSDGTYPIGKLYQGPAGKLYATASFGGTGICNDYGIVGCGVAFTLTQVGDLYTESVFHNFQASKAGIYPNDPVVQDGYAYISTCCGGRDQFGTLDRIALTEH